MAAIAAGAVLDPDRLLFRPGAKLISIPAPRIVPMPLFCMDYDRWTADGYIVVRNSSAYPTMVDFPQRMILMPDAQVRLWKMDLGLLLQSAECVEPEDHPGVPLRFLHPHGERFMVPPSWRLTS